jgi:polyhydroxybutyrate depolymerase
MNLRIFFTFLFISVQSVVQAREPETIRWTVGGVERQALVFAPSTSSKEKSPVIFAFHGHGGNMQFAARGMHFQDSWPEAIVVYPQGLPTAGVVLDREGIQPGWQHRPGQEQDRDLKFVDAMLETLRQKYSADDRRIYATGFSNGGLFTYVLWSQRPDIFAAFAPGGAALLPSVQLTQPRPAFHYAGQNDRLAAFAKQEKTIEEIRKLNGCASQGASCGTNCTLYPSASGSPVETFIHSGGHLYPPPVTELIAQFFHDHPRNP